MRGPHAHAASPVLYRCTQFLWIRTERLSVSERISKVVKQRLVIYRGRRCRAIVNAIPEPSMLDKSRNSLHTSDEEIYSAG